MHLYNLLMVAGKSGRQLSSQYNFSYPSSAKFLELNMLLNDSSHWAAALMKRSYLTMKASLKKNAAKGYYHNVSA